MKKLILPLFLIGIILVIWNYSKKSASPTLVTPTATINKQSKLKVSKIETFATGLGKARDLELSPEGTLFISDLSGRVLAVTGQNKFNAVLSDLHRPHGLAFYNGKLFVAEETQLVRYNFDEKSLKATFDKKILDLPKGGRHFTRSIAFDKSGKMYVTIGSTCDVCVERDPRNGSVIVSDQDGNNPHIFARGLRNSVFITINPKTDELWGTEMGRDWLGDEIPPDKINILRDGRDYGWPICYGDRVYDKNFGQKDPSYCQNTERPIYKIEAHSAPLGLTFHDDYLYVSYHGSWNRSTPIGYKVVRFKVDGNNLSQEETVLDFQNGDRGRPVDVIFNKEGSLFISDDKNGNIYKVDFQN